MRRYCRSPIPVPVHRPHLNRPAKSSRPGGSIEKCPTVGNVPSARDAANRRDFTFSTARWAMRPLPPPPRRTERHSTGTGCRETALPHGVTSEQRMLNPLLWQVCGTLGRFRCHAGQAVVRARVPASPSRASRLARTRDGRRDLRPVRPFPPTRPSSTPGGASNRRANCRSGDALAPGATEHKSDYWLVVSAVCSSKSTTSH